MKKVTEADFRMPEYRDALVEDYEFRADGKLVRKDRWEKGIYNIAYAIGLSHGTVEIQEVVDKCVKIVAAINASQDLIDALSKISQYKGPNFNKEMDAFKEALKA